jgi:cathepsin L
MLSALSFLLVVSVAVATGTRNLETYSFEQFLKEYKLSYPESEIAQRRELFNSELARVKILNSKNVGWQESINKYSAMTPKEKKFFRGRSKVAAADKKGRLQSTSVDEHSLPKDFKMLPVSSLPKHVDWRTKALTSSVKDQGYCGSCWAFASTAVIESHLAIGTGLLFDLSPQQIAMCSPNTKNCGGTGGCNGATAEIAFDYVAKSDGLYEEYQYPYLAYFGENTACNIPARAHPVATIEGYVKLPENNYTALMNAVANVGPVAISVDASAWSGYNGGIFNGCNQKNPDIDHAVVLMGYGEENGQKYWLIRNSWTASWGEQGYIRVARTDSEEALCGTDVTPHDGNACDGEDEPQTVCGTCGILFDSSYPTGVSTP